MSFKYWQEAMCDYEKLFETGEGYDVIIYAGENETARELHAHSNVLRTRSQYFRIALSSEWTKKRDGKFILKKPNVSPYLFKIILRFIYSGSINLTQLEGFDVLKLLIAVDELNLQSLISCIQDYFFEHKEEFLRTNPAGILEIIHNNEVFPDLGKSCLDEVCLEPEILVNSEKFVNLKANIIKVLFKRDDFYLEEIVIWESLIKWCLAKHKIPNDVTEWSKEEINTMGKTIQDFIPFIRFYQISSDDFFYKVIPYKKLLPMQLVNDILEFHIVSNKSNESNDDFPFFRQSRLIKYDTVLIVSRHFDIFASWIDKKENFHYNIKNIPYRFNLIYRASRDGWTRTAFFKNNKDIKMTITVAKIKDSEQIVGGYNPLVWDTGSSSKFSKSTSSYKSTRDSFIFSFKNRKYLQTAKAGYVNYDSYERAIKISSNKALAFGAGIDLCCNDNGTTWESCSQSYPNIDDIPKKFEVEEVECYQVINSNEEEIDSPFMGFDELS